MDNLNIMYKVSYLKEDLSNQLTNNKFRYKWEITSQSAVYVVELISTLQPKMNRLYVNNQMVYGMK